MSLYIHVYLLCGRSGSCMVRKPGKLGKYALRCPKKSCHAMIRRADVAYTPLWHMNKGGHLRYKAYLNALYVFSTKIPLDSSRHMRGCGYDSAENWSKMLRTSALAICIWYSREEALT